MRLCNRLTPCKTGRRLPISPRQSRVGHTEMFYFSAGNDRPPRMGAWINIPMIDIKIAPLHDGKPRNQEVSLDASSENCIALNMKWAVDSPLAPLRGS